MLGSALLLMSWKKVGVNGIDRQRGGKWICQHKERENGDEHRLEIYKAGKKEVPLNLL